MIRDNEGVEVPGRLQDPRRGLHYELRRVQDNLARGDENNARFLRFREQLDAMTAGDVSIYFMVSYSLNMFV